MGKFSETVNAIAYAVVADIKRKMIESTKVTCLNRKLFSLIQNL